MIPKWGNSQTRVIEKEMILSQSQHSNILSNQLLSQKKAMTSQNNQSTNNTVAFGSKINKTT